MNILEKIVNNRKKYVEVLKVEKPLESLTRAIDGPSPFFRKNSYTLIAECKKGSPSRGIFLEDFDAVTLAKEYKQGGATALSILTEPDFFFGSNANLINVKAQVNLPVLRKDFIFDRYQIKESWAIGADAILLIVACLSKKQILDLSSYAKEFNLEILLEVHNFDEMKVALQIPQVDAIGVNARNLKDFSIDLEATKKLCRMVPESKVAVAESGMKNALAGYEMGLAGFRAFLVGEYFIIAQDRVKTVSDFAKNLVWK